jgi:hypothetical protein
MIKNSILKKTSWKIGALGLFMSVGFDQSFGARGSKGSTIPLSTGITFPSSADATFLNPAALADGSLSNFRGVWLVESEEPLFHVTGATSSAGFGVGYQRVNANPSDLNFFEFGLGFNLSQAKLGFNIHSTNGENINGDMGLIVDFASTRMTLLTRAVSGGVDRIDFGLGYSESDYRIEFNVKKPTPFDNFDVLAFDLGFAVQARPFTLSLGMDFLYQQNSFSDFDFHAGLDIALSKALSLQGYYRPWPQERGGQEWVAGFKYIF